MSGQPLTAEEIYAVLVIIMLTGTEIQRENAFLKKTAGSYTHFWCWYFLGWIWKPMQMPAFYKQHLQGHTLSLDM